MHFLKNNYMQIKRKLIIMIQITIHSNYSLKKHLFHLKHEVMIEILLKHWTFLMKLCMCVWMIYDWLLIYCHLQMWRFRKLVFSLYKEYGFLFDKKESKSSIMIAKKLIYIHEARHAFKHIMQECMVSWIKVFIILLILIQNSINST